MAGCKPIFYWTLVITIVLDCLHLQRDLVNLTDDVSRSFDTKSVFVDNKRNIHQTDDLPRGSSGRWVLDFNYSNRADYPNYGSYSTWHLAAQNFTATPEQPHRLAASYRWVDDSRLPVNRSAAAAAAAIPGKGPLREVSLNEFCRACHRLGVSRIISLGDSLSNQFKVSLVSLLGFPPKGRLATGFYGNLRPLKVRCNVPLEGFDILVLWMRRSSYGEIVDLSKNGKHALQDNFIAQNPNKTAIVANFGAWLHKKEEFENALEAFLSWIDTSPMPDVAQKVGPIFYRETIPGHFPCKPVGDKNDVGNYDWKTAVLDAPFRNYDEYSHVSSSFSHYPKTYQWSQFEDYNEYARERFLNRSKSQIGITVPIYWLNVYNSTILRKDGHIGFGDCLHYYQPGPTDFWAHFFHSYLYDLAGTV